MDTNINNYDTIELLNVLKIPNHKEPNLREIYNSTKNIIQRLKTKKHLENKEELINFFKNALEKVTKDLSLRVPKDMMDNLINESKYDTLPEPSKDRFYQPPIVREQIYPGAIPPPIPNPIAFQTSNTKFSRGIVNPIKKESIKSMLMLHSKFRNPINQGTNSKTPFNLTTDFLVDLEEPLNNVVSLKLASCEFVNGAYPFSHHYKNNTFQIKVFLIDANGNQIATPGSPQKFKITVPEGNYTAVQMMNLLQSKINTNTGVAFNNQGIQSITVDYQSTKSKFYFRKTSTLPQIGGSDWGFDLIFSLDDEPNRDPELNMGWLLGYQKSIYYYNKDYISSGNQNIPSTLFEGYNPEQILDFVGSKFYLLEVNDFNKNYSDIFKYNTYKRNTRIKDILAKIPNTAPHANIVFEDSSDRVFKTRKYFGPVRIKKVRIRLLDDFGRLVDLNGGDLIVTLEVESLNMPYKNLN